MLLDENYVNTIQTHLKESKMNYKAGEKKKTLSLPPPLNLDAIKEFANLVKNYRSHTEYHELALKDNAVKHLGHFLLQPVMPNLSTFIKTCEVVCLQRRCMKISSSISCSPLGLDI